MEQETQKLVFKPEFGNMPIEELKKEGYEVIGIPALIVGGQPGIQNDKVQYALEDSNGPLDYDAILMYWKTDTFRSRPEDASSRHVHIFDGEIENRNFLIAYALKKKTK